MNKSKGIFLMLMETLKRSLNFFSLKGYFSTCPSTRKEIPWKMAGLFFFLVKNDKRYVPKDIFFPLETSTGEKIHNPRQRYFSPRNQIPYIFLPNIMNILARNLSTKNYAKLANQISSVLVLFRDIVLQNLSKPI